MEVLIKLNKQSAGRDKIARLLQYLSKFLWHRLRLNNKESANGFKDLEFQLSSFRKLLRFGQFMDTLHGTIPIFKHPDPIIKYSVISSKIFSSIFLLTDHYVWIGRSGLLKVNLDKWSRVSNKYWLYSLSINLLRDAYEILNILRARKEYILPTHGFTSTNDVLKVINRGITCISQNKAVVIDTLKNGCDFWIPFNALGYSSISPGTIGMLGVISSMAAIMSLIDPFTKISP